jgi:hypothetical protein
MKPPEFMPDGPAFCAIPGDGDVTERSIGAAARGAVAVGGGALKVRAPRLPMEPPNPGLAKLSAEQPKPTRVARVKIKAFWRMAMVLSRGCTSVSLPAWLILFVVGQSAKAAAGSSPPIMTIDAPQPSPRGVQKRRAAGDQQQSTFIAWV